MLPGHYLQTVIEDGLTREAALIASSLGSTLAPAGGWVGAGGEPTSTLEAPHDPRLEAAIAELSSSASAPDHGFRTGNVTRASVTPHGDVTDNPEWFAPEMLSRLQGVRAELP